MRRSKVIKILFIGLMTVLLCCACLVACSGQVTTYTITFMANGGEGTVEPQVAEGSIRLNVNVFENDGYAFMGWNTSEENANLNIVQYEDNANVITDKDLTLHAVWEEIVALEYSFNLESKTARITSASNLIKNISVPTTVKDSSGVDYTVTSIEDKVFYENAKLQSLVFEEDSQLKSIGNNAFGSCVNLTSIDIPKNVREIGDQAFNRCYGLTSITLPTSMSNIGDSAFFECTSLASITFPNDMSVISRFLFYGCSKLTSIVISDDVRTIGDSAFNGCGFESIVIPSGVTNIEKYYANTSIFENCINLESINVEKDNPNYSSIDGVLFNKSKDTLIAYPFGKHIDNYVIPNNVINIEWNSFYGINVVKTVTIPASLTVITASGFSHFTGLTSIIIPNTVKTIESYAFSGCIGLTSITIPDSVTSVEYHAFTNCTGLTSVKMSKSVLSIERYTFYECSALTDIIIPDGVRTIEDGGFLGCTRLETVIIPDSVSYIDRGAFFLCASLTSIKVDSGNPNYASIDGVLFDDEKKNLIEYPSGKSNDTYIIPSGVKTIGSSAFNDCTSLTSITIADSVTSIEDSAFRDCTALTSITIPSSVTSIGDDAFWGCNNLSNIYMIRESSEGMKLSDDWNSYKRGEGGVINTVWGYKG